jgi:glucosylceramidase
MKKVLVLICSMWLASFVTACGSDDTRPAGGTGGGSATAGSTAAGAGGNTFATGGTSAGSAATGGSLTGGTGGIAGGSGAGGAGGTGGGSSTQPQLITSASGAYWVTTGTLTEVTSGTADVTVNDSSTAQTWEGFGGAFNEMGWNYLSMLSQSDRDKALQLLFGTDGCRFAWGRIPMGATDYAMDRYTCDEVPSGSTDPSMSSFSITRDQEKLIPYVKAAQAIKGDIHFWASPWTPPTWMKQGPFNDDSAFDGGTIKGDDTTLNALAQYFVKFVKAYAQQGIAIEVVSPQNEPGYSGTYPTCGWAAATYASFVGQYLGPAVASAGLTTKIMLGTFNGGAGDTSIVSTVMSDATARNYIKVIGYQWGMQSAVSDAKQYNVPIWQTELKCGNYPWETPFNATIAPNDDAYAVESWGLIRDWIKAGVTAYGTWNMVLDTVGNGIDSERFWPQNALLTVDTSAKTLNITPTYYVFRHFAQFVDPGATVVEASGGDALAFKNPNGAIVTVMYNSGSATTYILSVAGKNLQFNMPGNGWATIVQ